MARQPIGYLRVSSTDQNPARQVESIDRLARSTHDLRELIHYFTGKGIGVEFVKEGLKFEPGADASQMGQLMRSAWRSRFKLTCSWRLMFEGGGAIERPGSR